MKKTKSNSKEVREKVREFITDSVYYYTPETLETSYDNFEDAAKHLAREFKRCTEGYEERKNIVDRFESYLRGWPFWLGLDNQELEDFLNGLGINPENKEYSTDEMYAKYSYLIWREIEKFYYSL